MKCANLYSRYPIADNFTTYPKGVSKAKVKEALKKQDLWAIEEAIRPAVYRYLQDEFKMRLLHEVRRIAKAWG